MTFNILDFIDQLEPDGGTNNPRGDHSFNCPACGAPNFKVNVITGKWFTYGCDCASTEAGKRAIREALSPARPLAKTGHSTCRADRLHRRGLRSKVPLSLQPNRPARKPSAPIGNGSGATTARKEGRSSRSIARTMARGTGRSGNDRWSIDSPLVMFSSSLFRTTATSPR